MTRPKQREISLPLDAGLTIFLDDRAARRCSPHTISFYRGDLQRFFTWCQTHDCLTLGDVQPAIIHAYLIHLQQQNLSDYTVHAAARSIRAFFNFCVTEELLDRSPMAKAPMPKLDKRILPAFTPADVERMLSVVEHAVTGR